ncbi:MAG: HTH domain-containing protein [Pseudomonadota bacterium]
MDSADEDGERLEDVEDLEVAFRFAMLSRLLADGPRSSRALAKVLGVSHTTVSRQIAGINQAFGFDVIETEEGGLSVSERLDPILLACRTSVGQLREIKTFLAYEGQRDRETVRIASSEGLMVNWLLNRLTDDPGAQRVRYQFDTDMEAGSGDTTDVFIHYDAQGYPGHITEIIGFLNMFPFAARSYVRRHMFSICRNALHRLTYISHLGRYIGADPWFSLFALKERNIAMSRTLYSTPLGTVLRSLLTEGRGVAIVPTFSMIVEPDLVPLRVGDGRAVQQISVCMSFQPTTPQGAGARPAHVEAVAEAFAPACFRKVSDRFDALELTPFARRVDRLRRAVAATPALEIRRARTADLGALAGRFARKGHDPLDEATLTRIFTKARSAIFVFGEASGEVFGGAVLVALTARGAERWRKSFSIDEVLGDGLVAGTGRSAEALVWLGLALPRSHFGTLRPFFSLVEATTASLDLAQWCVVAGPGQRAVAGLFGFEPVTEGPSEIMSRPAVRVARSEAKA